LGAFADRFAKIFGQCIVVFLSLPVPVVFPIRLAWRMSSCWRFLMRGEQNNQPVAVPPK